MGRVSTGQNRSEEPTQLTTDHHVSGICIRVSHCSLNSWDWPKWAGREGAHGLGTPGVRRIVGCVISTPLQDQRPPEGLLEAPGLKITRGGIDPGRRAVHQFGSNPGRPGSAQPERPCSSTRYARNGARVTGEVVIRSEGSAAGAS